MYANVPPVFQLIRQKWKQSLLIGGLGVFGLLIGGGAAALRTPSWYVPPVIAPAEQQKVRNNLVAAEQAFTESLRTAREPFVYQLLQNDVNRWIAMRREIYPLIDELAPPQLLDPFVVFHADEITLAGRYGSGSLAPVISIDLAPTMEYGQLQLRATAVRCGSVRMPAGVVDLGLSQHIQRNPEATWPGSPAISGDLLSGLRIGAQAWWKNGGNEYQLLAVQVVPGKLLLTIQPLGRRHAPLPRTHD